MAKTARTTAQKKTTVKGFLAAFNPALEHKLVFLFSVRYKSKVTTFDVVPGDLTDFSIASPYLGVRLSEKSSLSVVAFLRKVKKSKAPVYISLSVVDAARPKLKPKCFVKYDAVLDDATLTFKNGIMGYDTLWRDANWDWSTSKSQKA